MTNKIKADTQSNIAESSFDPFVPLTSQSLFWRAHYLKPSASLGALPLLFWLTECARPQLSVTLGMTDAVPHFALCQGIGKLGGDGICFGVDIQMATRRSTESDTNSDAKSDDLTRDVLQYNERHYSEFSQLLSGDHDYCSRLLEDSEIDMLVVSEFADQDLQESLDKHWLPRMSRRGVVLFLAGGQRLGDYIERFTKGSGSFALDAEKRVCLALHGDQHGDRLQRLGQLRVGKPGYLAVRNVFMRVGELHSNAIQLEQMAADEAGQAASQEPDPLAIEELQTRLAEQTELAEALASELKNKSSAIATAQSEAFDSKVALEKLREELQGKVQSLSDDHTRAQTRLEVVEADARTREEAAQRKIENLNALVGAQKLSMRERTQAYTDEITAAERKADEAEAARAKAVGRAEELETGMRSATARAADLERTLSEERMEAARHASQLSEQLKLAEKQQAQSEAGLKSLYADLESLGQEMREQGKALEESREEAEERRLRGAELETALDRSETKALALADDLEVAQVRIETTEASLALRIGELNTLGSELKAQADQISSTTEALAQSTDRADELEHALDNSQLQVADLKAEIAAVQSEASSASTSLALRLEEIAILGGELELKERSLSKLREDLAERTSRVTEVEQAVLAADVEADALRDQLSTASEALDTREREIEALRKEVAGKDADLAVAVEQSAQLTASINQNSAQTIEAQSALQQKLDAALRDLRTAQRKLKAVEQDRDAAYHRVTQLEHSTSWKVTAPLRRASVLVRGDTESPTANSDAD